MKVLVLSVFIAAVVLPAVSAYKCYSCNTDESASCNDPFTASTTTTTCETTSGQACAKIAGTINGKAGVFRGCMPNPDNSNSCKSKSEGGYSGTVCYCTSDKCNAAVKVFLPNSLIVVTSVAAAIKLCVGRFV